jgi:hypothetical protein
VSNKTSILLLQGLFSERYLSDICNFSSLLETVELEISVKIPKFRRERVQITNSNLLVLQLKKLSPTDVTSLN